MLTDVAQEGLEHGADSSIRTLRSNTVIRRFLRNGPVKVGSVIVLLIVLVAILAPVIAPRDPQNMVVRDRMHAPDVTYPFGTDEFGRDLLSRVIFGARVSLFVSGLVVTVTTVVGTIVGAIAGFFQALDNVLMRVMDAMMAFPSILLAIAIMSVLGRSELNVIVALSIVYIPTIARLVRASVLTTKQREYVEGVRALGGRDGRILFRHVLPATISPVVVQATFIAVYAILAEAGLSFLGAGAPPSVPSWGNILAEGRQYMVEAPWIMIFPGMAISITVLGLNLLGDGLRDLLDPRLRGSV